MIYKNYLKKLFLISIFFLLFNFNNSYSNNQIIIIAKIDNEIVTNLDVEKEYRYLVALNPSLRTVKKDKLLKIAKQSIIKEKVKQIEILKYYETIIQNAYFEEVFKSFYEGININSEKNFQKYLLEYNLKLDYVKKKINIETLWNELIVAKFTSKIIINENEIRQQLIANTKKYSKSFLVSEIFFATSDSKQIENIYNDIEKTIKNEGFNKAILTYSSSSTASTGGNLGWIQEEALNENLKTIFFEMNEGEYTKPITVPGGFLVLKINKIKEEKTNQNIEKKINEIIAVKKNDQLNQFSKMHFNKIKKDIKIYEF